MKGIYISGPISSNPNYRRDFAAAAKQVREMGFRPIDPTHIVPKEWPWDMAMKLCLDLIDLSDAVLMLDGWIHSKGAKRERFYAAGKGMPVFRRAEDLRRLSCGE